MKKNNVHNHLPSLIITTSGDFLYPERTVVTYYDNIPRDVVEGKNLFFRKLGKLQLLKVYIDEDECLINYRDEY